ncbi:GatB/YqeY domain-containing protein [bacterium]|nr:MAG: GatB/YqeY domain-containing protein [bacterium]
MLEEKIFNDYKEALKNKDSVKSSILSFLRSQMMNAALEKKKDKLDDNEVIAAIKKQIKQHQDSIEQFKSGGRQDLIDKETKELEILKIYIPEELAPDALKKVIEEVASELSASGMKDMGKVMKEVMARTAGKADSKLISDLVKQRLSL